jgi:hypothetical protein
VLPSRDSSEFTQVQKLFPYLFFIPDMFSRLGHPGVACHTL